MAEGAGREHFIPIRKTDLVELLCREPSLAGEERDRFRQLCRMLEATFHLEYHATLEKLKDEYSLFDPDADTWQLVAPTREERDLQMSKLFDEFVALLERANFKRLSHEDIVTALKGASDWGLNLDVNFAMFDRLEVFARGDTIGRRSRRRLRSWYRLEEVNVPVYQRLVLMFRLRPQEKLAGKLDTESVFIKIFKDIPKLDLEMLLPGTQVRLNILDRGKILFPALSGVAITIWKVIKGALTFALAGVYGTLAFIGLVTGTIGYGIRSFYGYLQTKQKYQLSLTQSLYYQNLDNNAGALFRLLNEAEEQECREAVLGYFFLWHWGADSGWPKQRLDNEIEEYLRRTVRVDVDFEIGDAIDKLKRLGIVEDVSCGSLRALPISAALERLDSAWDNHFQYRV